MERWEEIATKAFGKRLGSGGNVSAKVIEDLSRSLADMERKASNMAIERDTWDTVVDEIHRRAGVKRDGLRGIFEWIDRMKERGGK